MQGSTVVINPPDGNMSHYFASLERLYDEDIAWLAPGHGFLMERPNEVVERLLVHRLNRENKVVNALRGVGKGSVDSLVATVSGRACQSGAGGVAVNGMTYASSACVASRVNFVFSPE
jgi:glyoxylase-like metal-dependent hydrolase (beta-lactamase superfamily II)